MALSEPFAETWLDTGDGHLLHLSQHGNPQGVPILFLHGGPGAGCTVQELQLFDLNHCHIILLDQRGAGESLPAGELKHNDLLSLLTDLERIRHWLQLEQWCLVGGSFGATLGLIYSGLCPRRVMAQLYWGLFIPSDTGRDWLYGSSGAAKRFPIDYHSFVNAAQPRGSGLPMLFEAYQIQLHGGSRARHCVEAWNRWERVLAQPWGVLTPVPYRRDEATAKIEHHYAINRYFDAYTLLYEGRQQWPTQTEIIQGTQDWVCPEHLLREFLAQGTAPHQLTWVSGGFHGLAEDKMLQAVQQGCRRMFANVTSNLRSSG